MPWDSKIGNCWRYEYMDGGGPWFLPDGTARNPNKVPDFEEGDDVLYGCDTIENLNRYMARKGIDTSDMCLVHYLNVEILQYNPKTGHITFRKDFK